MSLMCTNFPFHLALQESVLQIIGTAEAVPEAAVELASLYQGDPSLPSCLHLNYSHALLAATPPPPPTPPPSPVLSNRCGRLSPHFSHPASMLQVSSGAQPVTTLSSWNSRPQDAPLIHALRASTGSQEPVLYVPSVVSSDSNIGAQPSQHERLLAAQMQGLQGPSYLPSVSLGGLHASHYSTRDSQSRNPATSRDEKLISELQEQLGAVATAAAGEVVSSHQLLPSPAVPTPSRSWQQHQLRALQHQRNQQHHINQRAVNGVPATEWQDLQHLNQICLTQAQQRSISREQQQAGGTLQNLQPGLLQHLEELQQSLVLQQLVLQQQQLTHQPQTKSVDEHSMPSSLSAPSQLHLQQLQQQLQLLQVRQPNVPQYAPLDGSTQPLSNSVVSDDQQRLLALSQQLQQQIQQHQTQLKQRLSQQVNTAQLQAPTSSRGSRVLSNHQDLGSRPDASLEQLPQLQQLQQFHEMAIRAQNRCTGIDKPKYLEAELLQPQSHEAASGGQLLSPMPPPQWTQMSQQQHQQHLTDWRAAQCSPTGTPQDVPLQQPQRQLPASIPVEAAVGLTLSPTAHSLSIPASVEAAPNPSDVSGAQGSQIECDPNAVRKLVAELLKMIGQSGGGSPELGADPEIQHTIPPSVTIAAGPDEGFPAKLPEPLHATEQAIHSGGSVACGDAIKVGT